MPESRPLQKLSIDDLEQLAKGQMDGHLLETLIGELRHRKRKRATDLLDYLSAKSAKATANPRPKHIETESTRRKASRSEPQVGDPPPRPTPTSAATKRTDRSESPPAPTDSDTAEQLPTHLQEFIIALKEEVEAAKRNLGSNAALLSDGHLIAPVGGGFHYRFQSQRPLRVPPDTEGFLAIAGVSEDIQVTVIEIEDLSVVLELPQKLGAKIQQAKLKTDLTMLLLRLIERIETKGASTQKAADRILGLGVASTASINFKPANQRLNPEQRAAVGTVLGSDTVFIWGPPGTGKTQTIGEIGTQLFRGGKTLLIASHTNTAVDEALLRIAEALGAEFAEGEVLRLGEPVKSELQARPDLILKRVAEKRSATLEEQKKTAEQSKVQTLVNLETMHRTVEIAEWLQESASDIHEFQSREEIILSEERQVSELATQLAEKQPFQEALIAKRQSAVAILLATKTLGQTEQDLAVCEAQCRAARITAENTDAEIRDAESLLALSVQAEPEHLRLAALPSAEQARIDLGHAATKLAEAQNRHLDKSAALQTQSDILTRTLAVGAIKRMWQKLPKPEYQEALVRQLEAATSRHKSELEAAKLHHDNQAALVNEIASVLQRLASFSKVPRLTVCEERLRQLRQQKSVHEANCDRLENECSKLKFEIERLANEVAVGTSGLGATAEVVFEQTSAEIAAFGSTQEKAQTLSKSIASMQRCLAQDVAQLLAVLANWGLCGDADGEGYKSQMAMLRVAKLKAQERVGPLDLRALTTERDRLSALAAQLIEEIKLIEEALKQVEADLLASVRVLATTLTRSFMREGIQQRVFDTVLVDEASMAPIPALWAAATLAERCIVAVGDFKQLPPIVQAEHIVAQRWLGRDVFEASGVQGAWERGAAPEHFVALKEQHRMHPSISGIVNELIYNGLLRDGGTVTESKADESIQSWHGTSVADDERVTIIDTARALAWNTSANRSRFNLLSAMMAMTLVRQWLASDRPKLADGKPKRVLVICPYRPQAKLLDVLVREDSLEIEVSANTAHSFQGSEADAVVLDLVLDEPHFSANLLTPAASNDIARLLNVAITRAKRKLCILADLSWFQAKGRSAFVGGKLLPWLVKRSRVYDALEMFKVSGGNKEQHAVFSQEEALNHLIEAVTEAREEVVVFSPSLNPVNVKALIAGVGGKCTRMTLVTQTVGEQRSRSQSHSEAESLLHSAGVALVHKLKMLDKMVLVDGSEVWTSTFPILGEAPSRGFVIRRRSRKFASEVKDACCIEKLLAPCRDGLHRCPICNKEMVAAESKPSKGSKAENPFYWRCIEDGCYSRDPDTPPPVNGLISFKCESLPEFGYWGEVAHWLCTCGQKPSHRTKIHRNHLRLPKMRALIPQRSWNKVCRELGFDPDARVQGDMFDSMS